MCIELEELVSWAKDQTEHEPASCPQCAPREELEIEPHLTKLDRDLLDFVLEIAVSHRNGPSRSAQSTSGERWAAAVERIALSTMQPSMIFKFERAGGVDHRQRAANAAALHELHVDAVDAAGQREQVAGVLGIFVGDDWNRRALANPAQPLGRTRRNRLFAKFDLEALEFAQQHHRRLGRPGFVRVDADGAAVDRPDRRDRFDLRTRTELDS